MIHVAGTNGKGSTCAMIASILQASGKNIGLYTSPHLIRFNERIRINGYPIPDKKIINFMKKVGPVVQEIESTFFETTTAMAFQHFSLSNVDIAVIETGLGGRLDATNVLNPIVVFYIAKHIDASFETFFWIWVGINWFFSISYFFVVVYYFKAKLNKSSAVVHP